MASAKYPYHRGLAELWLAIGDHEQAKIHAVAAYQKAWGDGEPYVNRYELNKARSVLNKIGAEIPNLPPFDPATAEKFSLEDEVIAFIEKKLCFRSSEIKVVKISSKASILTGIQRCNSFKRTLYTKANL